MNPSSQYVFAINWLNDGTLSSSNLNSRDASSVDLEISGSYHSDTDLTNGAELATYTMARFWNVNFATSGVSMDEDVNVRFFYDDAEKTAIETAANNFASTYTNPVYEGFAWF